MKIIEPLQQLMGLCERGPGIETEIRLTGLTQPEFALLHKKMSAATCWKDVKQQTVTDFFWGNVRGTADGTSDMIFISKVKLARREIKHESGLELVLTSKEEQKRKFRLMSKPAEKVRIKKRTSFLYMDVQYDLSVVWTGKTKEEAIAEPPQLEVEIEFLPVLKNDKATNPLVNAAILVERALQLIDMARPQRKNFYSISLA